MPLRYDEVFYCYPWKGYDEVFYYYPWKNLSLVVLVRILKKHHPFFSASLNKYRT